MNRLTHAVAAVLLSVAACVLADDAPSKTIQSSDKSGLEAAIGEQVTVEGKVEKAAWSKSGKVLNIAFVDAPNFISAAFAKNKDKLDAAFGGDFAKAVDGAKVQLTGKIAKYRGFDQKFADATQLIVSTPDQVKILTPATSQPSTAPAIP